MVESFLSYTDYIESASFGANLINSFYEEYSFLTLVKINKKLDEQGIYTDLLQKFRDEGHEVLFFPSERRDKKPAIS
jgi:hypothetical protein